LEDRRSLRKNGTEAQRATAARMRVSGASLGDVGAYRHIIQRLRRFGARAVVLMASPERTGLAGVLSSDVTLADGKGKGQRRRHRPKQICDGEKPSPPSSLWLR
jgi:hypothetical protein